MKLGIPLLVGGVTATGVVAFGGYYVISFKGPSIRRALGKSKLISDLNSSDRTKQWEEEFKSDRDNIKKAIPNLKEISTDERGGEALSKWCDDQMDLDSNKNPEIFSLVKKYCLIRSLSSQLERNNKHLLSKSQSKEWSATYKKRKDTSSKRSDVGLSGDSWIEGKEQEELPIIQKRCEDVSVEEFLASDSGSKYALVLKWCTKEGATES